MSSVANITIHRSQFPDAVHRDLLESLRTRCVNHKFHYDSVKQTQKWLDLHQAYSPSRTDESCRTAYEKAFVSAASATDLPVHVIGLGCGGGQKDSRLLAQLRAKGEEVFYTPSDVSTAMVLVAREVVLKILPEKNCTPLVCDLTSAHDLPDFFNSQGPAGATRLITFFGMIPNFEPESILPKLTALLQKNDVLLFSANLAPGSDYAAGVRRILPQYDNPFTREWLMTFLLDLGVERGDGELQFSIAESPGAGWRRIEANFLFEHPRTISVGDEKFSFLAGEKVRLFFSYRYTPQLIRSLLNAHNLDVRGEWISDSAEEGVFLCKRK